MTALPLSPKDRPPGLYYSLETHSLAAFLLRKQTSGGYAMSFWRLSLDGSLVIWKWAPVSRVIYLSVAISKDKQAPAG